MARQEDVVGMLNRSAEFWAKVQKSSGQSADAIMQQVLSGERIIQFCPKAPDASNKAIENWKEKGLRSAYDGVKLTSSEFITLYKTGERNFEGAILRNKCNNNNNNNNNWTNLCGTDLGGANLIMANLSGSNFWLAKNLTAEQLATVQTFKKEEIEKIQHFLSLIRVTEK